MGNAVRRSAARQRDILVLALVLALVLVLILILVLILRAVLILVLATLVRRSAVRHRDASLRKQALGQGIRLRVQSPELSNW